MTTSLLNMVMDSTNKMIIKLKIPVEVRLECPTCSKCFSSVKALGGHKRIHMEKKNKRNHEIMELQGDENGGDKTLISCPVCHQPFTSEKSLHGHMRKHPERGWRGMRPPPPSPPQKVAEDSPPLDHEAVSGARVLLALASSQPPHLLQDRGKSFRSYQALGGHKSYHSDMSALRPCMEHSEGFGEIYAHGQLAKDKGKEGIGDQFVKIVFDFDLNEFPKW